MQFDRHNRLRAVRPTVTITGIGATCHGESEQELRRLEQIPDRLGGEHSPEYRHTAPDCRVSARNFRARKSRAAPEGTAPFDRPPATRWSANFSSAATGFGHLAVLERHLAVLAFAVGHHRDRTTAALAGGLERGGDDRVRLLRGSRRLPLSHRPCAMHKAGLALITQPVPVPFSRGLPSRRRLYQAARRCVAQVARVPTARCGDGQTVHLAAGKRDVARVARCAASGLFARAAARLLHLVGGAFVPCSVSYASCS